MMPVPRSLHLNQLQRLSFRLFSVAALVAATVAPATSPEVAFAQASGSEVTSGQALTLRADVQEANAVTGVITARGNVQINYPARQIQATSIQAQYYSRERRIVLTGDVYVLQNGNSLRGETITYLVDEGRFVALPDSGQQVESIYLVQDPDSVTPPTSGSTSTPTGEQPDPFNPKPEFKTPVSPAPEVPQ
jgi:lipopolysaccharide export system protein LptA